MVERVYFVGIPVETPEEALKGAEALANSLNLPLDFFGNSRLSFLAACMRYLAYFSCDDMGEREAVVGLPGLVALSGLQVIDLFDRLMTVPGNEMLLRSFLVPLKARCKDQLQGMIDEFVYRIGTWTNYQLAYKEGYGFKVVGCAEGPVLCALARAVLKVNSWMPATEGCTFLGMPVGTTAEAVNVATKLLNLFRRVKSDFRTGPSGNGQSERYYLAMCLQFIARMSLDPKVDAQRLQSFLGLAVLVDRNILRLFDLFSLVPELEELFEPFRSAWCDRDYRRLIELTCRAEFAIYDCLTFQLCVDPDGEFYAVRLSRVHQRDKEIMELKKMIDAYIQRIAGSQKG